MTDNISRPYKSTVHIALPSNQYAQHLKDVVSVDEEVSNKVFKSFSIVTSQEVDGSDVDRGNDAIIRDGGDADEQRVLRINFMATDAKMLRVAMSTTYDMINVALKCFQEFEE
ncbi:hypothetical protein QTG54_003591 [Skeletonema marinoi]|uniref:Uncharacterized protein n=1 Tax=Skeletonema marinoi TaxID=267567 RepID=A0AAD8YGG5_9STRA|nr:hypothetical protein QTG54_003591 [Skeletonema marinoi]